MDYREDKDAWPTKQDAARLLQCSERTLEMKIKAGEVRAAYRSRPGKKPFVIVHPADIETLQHSRVKVEPMPMAKNEGAKTKPKSESETAFRKLRDALAACVIQPPFDKIRWIPLSRAAGLIGLPKRVLESAVAAGALSSLRGGRQVWIKWTDLEVFHPEGDIPKPKPRAIALQRYKDAIPYVAITKNETAQLVEGER